MKSACNASKTIKHVTLCATHLVGNGARVRIPQSLPMVLCGRDKVMCARLCQSSAQSKHVNWSERHVVVPNDDKVPSGMI